MKTCADKDRMTDNHSAQAAAANKSYKTQCREHSQQMQVNKGAGLSNIIANSPLVAAQRKLQDAIDNSPRQLNTIANQVSQSRSPVQCVSEDEELLQGRFETLQRKTKLKEEEVMQGNFNPIQRQVKSQQKQNKTGLPDKLKSGIETFSGISMDNVRVHYNSDKPAQLNALAYAQGTDIHVAPGQQQHLPHEAWHVVQQAQGRVKPTIQVNNGVQVNDDASLEREADIMGTKSAS